MGNSKTCYLVLVLASSVISGCLVKSPKYKENDATYQFPLPNSCQDITQPSSLDSSLERDTIYGLLAYSIVLKDWQTDADYDNKTIRGHNIGSVLVDDKGAPVFWARNANYKTNNGSQHGEVRLIRNYLEAYPKRYLTGFTIYTTLEPCAMCTGMASLTQVKRVVYGQKDLDYGDAPERLFKDFKDVGGYKSYPRKFEHIPLNSDIRTDLDKAFKASPTKSITRWLRQAGTKAIYKNAERQLFSMTTKFEENKAVLTCAKDFYDVVSDEYVHLSF